MINLSRADLVYKSKDTPIRILIVTSCTGEKRFKPSSQLTLVDFKDPEKLALRSNELAEFSCPAIKMYTGLQHLRAVEGVEMWLFRD